MVPLTEVLSYISHYCFSGKRDLRNGHRFLVAGGGTGDAAVGLAEQLREYDSEIVYVDISQASMAIARERARIRGLEDRVKWVHGSLLSVAEMGLGMFDYVNSSGVLHHLENPQDGLNALASVLKPDGAMGLMLYAKYGRMAVYQMQEILRLINHDTTVPQETVDNAKVILNAIPNGNWFLSSPPIVMNEIASGDAAIYDMLLHSQDRAYSIPELYEYLRASGLDLIELYPDEFVLGKKQYDPVLYIKDAALLEKAKRLPREKQQQLAELLNGKICKHTFHAARKLPPLPSIADPDMVPFLNDSFITKIYEEMYALIKQSGDIVTMRPSNENMAAMFIKTPHLETFMKYFDGKRSMGELVQLVQGSIVGAQKPSYNDLVQEFSLFYQAMNQYNWLLLRHKSIPPYTVKSEMQARVTRLYPQGK